MDEYSLKLDKFLMPLISNISNPIILELGVENGRSTKKFLQICKKNNGKLFSVDTKDCSKILDAPNWNFFKTRDDNFEFIDNQISKNLDFIYIDSYHEPLHVEKVFTRVKTFTCKNIFTRFRLS